jgi:riboflavin-specific deaminase-like protein
MASGMGSFRQLIPSVGECDAAQALAGWREEPPRDAARPRIALNMIESVDGRIAVDGRSGALGGPADRELFHALRADCDAVMAAAGTVRAERYGPIIRDAGVRERRDAAGLRAQPLAVIVTRSLDLDVDLPLLADSASHVVVLGPTTGTLPATAATVDYIRHEKLADGLAELRERFGTALVVCEGGPSLNGSLHREDLIDELFVAISPNLVGGELGPSLIADHGVGVLRALELRMLLHHDSELYARYVVVP